MKKKREHRDVFISYSSKDYRRDGDKEIMSNNVISKVLKALDDEEITYWFSDKSLYPGDDNGYIEALAQGIYNCSCLLFISSTASNHSKWTLKELRTAHEERHLPIIPLDIDNSKYSASIEFYIGDIQKINYKQDEQKALEKTQDAILNIIQRARLNKEYEYRIISNEDAVLFVDDKEWPTPILRGKQTIIKLKNGVYKISLRSTKYPMDYAEKTINIHYSCAFDFYKLGLQRFLLHVGKYFLIILVALCALWGNYFFVRDIIASKQEKTLKQYSAYDKQVDALCVQLNGWALSEPIEILNAQSHIVSLVDSINTRLKAMDSIEQRFDTLPSECLYKELPKSNYYSTLSNNMQASIVMVLQNEAKNYSTPDFIKDVLYGLVNKLSITQE